MNCIERVYQWMNIIEEEQHKKCMILSYSYPFFYWYKLIQQFLMGRMERTLIIFDQNIESFIPQSLQNKIISQNIQEDNFNKEYIFFTSTGISNDIKENIISYGWDRIIYVFENIETSAKNFTKFYLKDKNTSTNPIIWVMSCVEKTYLPFSIPMSAHLKKILLMDNIKNYTYIEDHIPIFHIFRSEKDINYMYRQSNYSFFIENLHYNQTNICTNISEESIYYSLWKEFNINNVIFEGRLKDTIARTGSNFHIPYTTTIISSNNENNLTIMNDTFIKSILPFVSTLDEYNIYYESYINSFSTNKENNINMNDEEDDQLSTITIHTENVFLLGIKNKFMFIPFSNYQKENYKKTFINYFHRTLNNIDDQFDFFLNESMDECETLFTEKGSSIVDCSKYIVLDNIIDSIKNKKVIVYFSNNKVSKQVYNNIKKKYKGTYCYNLDKSNQKYLDCKEKSNYIVFISGSINNLWKLKMDSNFLFDEIIFWNPPSLSSNKKLVVNTSMMFEVLLLCHTFSLSSMNITWIIWNNSHELYMIEKLLGAKNDPRTINNIL